jgi:succinate semialdehyde reductase (NADPH)
MRAAVLRGPWDLRIEDVRDPRPGPDEVLVAVEACGVCHSDLHQIKHELPVKLPRVLGHEMAGVIVALGERVEEPVVGTGVVAPFIMPCGTCSHCRSGRDDFCSRFWSLNRSEGVLYDGTTRLYDAAGEPLWMDAMSAFGELAVLPAASVFPTPRGMALGDLAPLGCAFFTAYGALRHSAQVVAGESVAIIGVGGVGTSLVMLAAVLGAQRIIAVDVAPEKLCAALALGATDAIDATREDVVDAVAEITDGQGVHVALEALGRAQTLSQACEIVGSGGRVVAIGVTPAGVSMPLDVNSLVRRQVRIIGAYGGRAHRDMPDLLKLVEAGSVSPAATISRRVALEDLPETFIALDRGEIVGRAVVALA